MPEAILKFNLPEEASEFHDAVEGTSYLVALQEMDEFLRQKLKYGGLKKGEGDAYEQIREKLSEILLDRKIDLF
jgi:hypothetical protein